MFGLESTITGLIKGILVLIFFALYKQWYFFKTPDLRRYRWCLCRPKAQRKEE